MVDQTSKTYCIIDIETTGGSRGRNKITEIAIIKFDGINILEKYSTLINPEMSIPYQIIQLTGISNEMVEDAPKFYEVAKKIVEMTEGSIFVAHNVFFDYNFIQAEFRDLGFTFKRDKMCTVRLARKIIPGHKSYSLGNICHDFGITITNRHRALGDAEATTELFKILLEKSPEMVETVERTDAKKLSLPPMLDKKSFDDLPNCPGVYFFWNDKDELLYIGKSKEIKKRVSSHFRLNIKRQKDIELKNSVRYITYQKTGSDFIARVLECHLIKTKFPFFNVSLRKRKYPYELTLIYNKENRASFKISSSKTSTADAILFRSQNHGKRTIEKFYRDEFGLNQHSHFFEKQIENFINTIGLEKYNEKFENFMKLLQYPEENFKIKFSGRSKKEICFLVVRENRISEIEYIDQKNFEKESFQIEEDTELRSMFSSYLAQHRPKLILEDNDSNLNEDQYF